MRVCGCVCVCVGSFALASLTLVMLSDIYYELGQVS